MKKNPKKLIRDILQVIVWPVGVYLIFFVLCRVLNAGTFGSLSSIRMVLVQSVPATMLAWAMSGNMLSKRWDFSIGNMMILTCLAGVPLAELSGLGAWGVLIFTVLFGALFGLINGMLYTTLKIPMLLISVGMMKVYECVGYLIRDGRPAELGGSMKMFGQLPWNLVLLILMGLFYYYLYFCSSFGGNYHALRDGQGIAVNNHVNERRNAILCCVIMGIFVGMAGVAYSGMSGIVESSPSQNNSMNMMCTAFAPIFIGRYLSRHVNITVGIFVGTLTMKLLTSGIVAVGLPSPMQNVGNGAFLILFMAISANQDRINDWHARRKMAAEIRARKLSAAG